MIFPNNGSMAISSRSGSLNLERDAPHVAIPYVAHTFV